MGRVCALLVVFVMLAVSCQAFVPPQSGNEAPTTPPTRDFPVCKEGDEVMALYPGDGDWYKATISSIGETRVTVKWEDDGSEDAVTFSDIQAPACRVRPVCEVGDDVMALWSGDGAWYEATISSVGEYRLTVTWDDDDSNAAVMFTDVAKDGLTCRVRPVCEAGDHVMALYPGDGDWYEAVIDSIGDTRVTVTWADDKSEDAVTFHDVTKDGLTCRVAPVCEEGDDVMALYPGDGNWYEATISGVGFDKLTVTWDDDNSMDAVTFTDVTKDGLTCRLPKCVCSASWSSEEDNLDDTESCMNQEGCPDTACGDKGDDEDSWCIVANSPCHGEQDGDEWAYCEVDDTDSPSDSDTDEEETEEAPPPLHHDVDDSDWALEDRLADRELEWQE